MEKLSKHTSSRRLAETILIDMEYDLFRQLMEIFVFLHIIGNNSRSWRI